jgi:hypothetical protein
MRAEQPADQARARQAAYFAAHPIASKAPQADKLLTIIIIDRRCRRQV